MQKKLGLDMVLSEQMRISEMSSGEIGNHMLLLLDSYDFRFLIENRGAAVAQGFFTPQSPEAPPALVGIFRGKSDGEYL